MQITVFARKPESDLLFFAANAREDRPQTLEGLIEFVLSKGAHPVAWAGAFTVNDGGDMHKDDLHAAAIKSGRLIDLVDGKYIPRIPSLPADATEQAEIDAAKCQPAHVSHVEPERAEPSVADRLRDLLRVQAGECGQDEYMNGLYNGMELALSLIEGRDPVFFTKKSKAPAAVASKALPALPALQKMNEGGNALHGSAALLLKD
jgi:hypothetical protein